MIDDPQDQFQRARALHQRGMFAEAGTIYHAILQQQPDNFDVLHLTGILALQTGRPEQGVDLIGKALRLRDDDAGAHGNLGLGLRALRRHVEALASHDRAIALRPDFAQAYSNRGLVLADMQRHEEALASHDRAIALKPDLAEAHVNRGVVLAGLRRQQEALVSFDRAIALKPDHAELHYNRARLLADLQRREEALASYDRAIALRPDYAEAHWNQSHCLLTLGRFAQGWRLFEWRNNLETLAATRAFPRPLWLGEASIAGKTLFIHWEQGLGDTIQFCRYATLAQALGAQVERWPASSEQRFGADRWLPGRWSPWIAVAGHRVGRA